MNCFSAFGTLSGTAASTFVTVDLMAVHRVSNHEKLQIFGALNSLDLPLTGQALKLVFVVMLPSQLTRLTKPQSLLPSFLPGPFFAKDLTLYV